MTLMSSPKNKEIRELKMNNSFSEVQSLLKPYIRYNGVSQKIVPGELRQRYGM